jgi:hypothetical protein
MTVSSVGEMRLPQKTWDHLLCNLSLGKKHPEHLVLKDGFQLFQLQGRGDAEHALVAIETAVRHENVCINDDHLYSDPEYSCDEYIQA